MSKDLALFLAGQLASIGLLKTNNSTVQSYIESQIDSFLTSQKRVIAPAPKPVTAEG